MSCMLTVLTAANLFNCCQTSLSVQYFSEFSLIMDLPPEPHSKGGTEGKDESGRDGKMEAMGGETKGGGEGGN
jgi:hypothetical protein